MKIGGKVRKIDSVDIGEGNFPVICTHVGITDTGINCLQNIQTEKEKASIAIRHGANIICDVSLSKDIKTIQKSLLEDMAVPLGAVSIYETYIRAEEKDLKIPQKEFISIIYEQIMRGIDVITLHATVFRDDRKYLKNSNRVIPTTSRGGVMMLEMLEKNKYENPYYVYFNEILDICKEYNVAISLGPTYRPASVIDGTAEDELHTMELIRMGHLVKMAQLKNVVIMIEGIGHASLNNIPSLIQKAKDICGNVPYRVMPVSTDIAIGFDHISFAIAAATAVYYGADSITCVTRSEHIGIPSLDDVKESVIVGKIASYSGYIAKTKIMDKDHSMSLMRAKGSCRGCYEVSIASDYQNDVKYKSEELCTMCGNYCPLKKIL